METRRQRAESFAGWFNKSIEAASISVMDLALLVNKTPAYLRQLLNASVDKATGKPKIPDAELVKSIAIALNQPQAVALHAAGYSTALADPSEQSHVLLQIGNQYLSLPDDARQAFDVDWLPVLSRAYRELINSAEPIPVPQESPPAGFQLQPDKPIKETP